MTPTEAARRLVGLPGWHWDERMADGGTASIGADAMAGMWVLLPDLEDDATRGIVLGMLSRRVGAYCWIRPTGLVMSVYRECPHCQAERMAVGPSWAEAFVRAWEATAPTPAPATPPPPNAAESS